MPARARARAARREVVVGGLRLLQPRPGDVHRGHGGQAAARAPATPRTCSRSRATSAASPAAVPTWSSPCCATPTPSRSGSDGPLATYFRLNPVPKVVGFDARLQLLHYDDLVAVLHHAALAGRARHLQRRRRRRHHAVAGAAPARPGRPCPLPRFAMTSLGLRRAPDAGSASPDYSPEQVDFLTYGRGVDTTRMRTVLGFEPRYTTEQALAGVRHLAGARARRRTIPSSPWRTSSPEPWEARVADAEIIPLGTRGRPGRGTGRDKPSASSRNLAGNGRRPADARRRRRGPDDRGRPRPRHDTFDAAVEPPRTRSPAAATPTLRTTPVAARRSRAAEPPGARPGSRADDGAGTRSRVDVPTADRGPTARPDPVSGPARRRARAPPRSSSATTPTASSPRRWRSCGAGSPATTSSTSTASTRRSSRRFLMEMVRPLATKWFRVEVRGVENIPHRRRRAGRRQPLRHGPGRRHHDDVRRARDHRSQPAPARRRPGLQAAVHRRGGPQGRRHPGLQRGRHPDARPR